jgi:hypothetical protein
VARRGHGYAANEGRTDRDSRGCEVRAMAKSKAKKKSKRFMKRTKKALRGLRNDVDKLVRKRDYAHK